MFLREFLPYRLNSLAEAVSARVLPIYRRRHGMTRPEWRILANLAEAPEASARELGEMASLHKTKISRALQALEDRGWVSRSVDDADRRIVHARLTAKGIQAFAHLRPEMSDAVELLLGSLTAAERRKIAEALDLIERALRTKPGRRL